MSRTIVTIEMGGTGANTAAAARNAIGAAANTGGTFSGAINAATANISTIETGNALTLSTGTASNGNIIFSSNGSEDMRITNTGMIGIFTTTPNSNLTIVGNVWATTGINAATMNATTSNAATFISSAGINVGAQAINAYGSANLAYEQANNARAQANSARDQANTARSDANTTFATINTTFATLNTSAATQNTNIGNAHDQANAARLQANTARTTANDAYNNANTRLSTSGGSISGDLSITGNLTVQGNATTINVSNLSVNDSIILLSNGAVGDSTDIGFVGHFDRGPTATHAGLIRKATLNEFFLFDNYEVEPTNNVIDVAGQNFRVGNLRLGIVNANSVLILGSAAATQANLTIAHNQANSARDQANTARSDANTTFGTINTTFATLNTSAATQNTNIGNAYDQANSARGQANTAYGQANLAYAQANTARSDANTTFATVNTTFATINTTTATMNTATSNRVLKAGDTMTGNLTLSAASLVMSSTSNDQRVIDLDNTGALGRHAALPLRFMIGSASSGYPFAGYNAIPRANGAYSYSGADTAWGINYGNNNRMGFYYAASGTAGANISFSELMTITSGGNVGIGSAIPSRKLDVIGDSNSGIRLKQGGQIAYALASNTFYTGLVFENQATAHAWSMGYNQGAAFTINWFDADANTFANRVLITSTGSVGIGTTGPAQRLDVRGYVVSDVNSNQVEGGFYLGNSNHGIRRPVGTNDVYVHTNSGALYLGTTGANTQQITLLNNGNFGINTAAPSSRLDVNGLSSLRNGIQFYRINTPSTGLSFYTDSYTSWCIYMASTGVGSCGPHGNFTSPGSGHGVTSWALRSFIENASGYGFTWESGTSSGNPTVIAGLASATGNFSVAGTVTANSDERVKKNIRPIKNALEKVKQITGVHFEKIDSGEKNIGVIAQEVEKVLPEVVKLGDPNDRDSIKSVAYGNMVGLLIEAIKEQQKQIEELKAKLSV